MSINLAIVSTMSVLASVTASNGTIDTPPALHPVGETSMLTATSGAGPAGFRLRLMSDDPQPMTFHMRVEKTLVRPRFVSGIIDDQNLTNLQQDTFKRICTSPCEAIIPQGVNVFAVTRGASDEMIYARPLFVDGDATVKTRYIDNSSARATGYWGGGIVAAAGIGLLIAGIVQATASTGRGFDDPDFGKPGIGPGLIMGGATALTIGMSVATLVAFTHPDEVEMYKE